MISNFRRDESSGLFNFRINVKVSSHQSGEPSKVNFLGQTSISAPIKTLIFNTF